MTTKPANHKHFIVASANFKLDNNNQKPDNLQSTILFKLGDKKISETRISETSTIEENEFTITRENKIIPSSLIATTQTPISSAETQLITTSNGNLNRIENSLNNTSSQSITNPNDVLNRIENVLNNGTETSTGKLERPIINEIERNSPSLSYTPSEFQNDIPRDSLSDNGRILRDPRQRNRGGRSCNACNSRNASIAWNKWRSDIQNRIMDDSDVSSAHFGTIFYFTFVVNKNRKISNVKVICTEISNSKSVSAVKDAIINLEGDEILEFPRNSARSSVEFTGGFLMGITAQYSTPENYNDYENIRIQY